MRTHIDFVEDHGPVTETVRPPLQARSRDSWERVLQVGLDLLETDGYDGFTIGEICRRAKVSAPSIYARVDGRSELFLAVYEVGMRGVAKTEIAELAVSGSTVEGVTCALANVFAEHSALLRAVIARAAEDPALLAIGARISRAVVVRFSDAITGVPAERSRMLMRTVYAECSFRAMYGSAFWGEVPETELAYRERLVDLANAIAAAR